MINSVCISGYLSNDPKHYEDKNYCIATINCPRPEDEFFYLIAYGEAAKILSSAKSGNMITVSGTLRSRHYQFESLTYLRTEIKATQIQIHR